MITDKEKRVLAEMCKNPRASYRQLAKKAGVAPATFIQRVRDLEKGGVITGYRAMVDPEKLGYNITAIIEVQAKRGGFFKSEEKIAKLPNVCAIYEVTGPFDFFIIARFKHREELSTFVRELLATDSIERTSTRVVVNSMKEDFSSIDGK